MYTWIMKSYAAILLEEITSEAKIQSSSVSKPLLSCIFLISRLSALFFKVIFLILFFSFLFFLKCLSFLYRHYLEKHLLFWKSILYAIQHAHCNFFILMAV